MNWRRWINKDNETLFDLIFGCIVYSIVFEAIGLLVVENKGSYSLGLLLGTAVAIGLSVSMYKSLNNCLVMTEHQARRNMVFSTLLRAVVILLAAWIGMRSRYFSFPGIIIGILGLKISAYFHAYTNVYITKKLYKKGR
ncbi:MAG: ATP synthase subunit I [Anaerobutyricum hallii]|uniref:ATP synthase subunit I n=1 Tax=Anaerobutyricum hallii TaxID=39488 RepID=UPI003520A13B